MKQLTTTEVTTVKTTVVTITAQDIREAFGLPSRADVTLRVPGGGDWSNTNLDLCDHPVKARWSETESKGTTDEPE